MAAFGAIVVMLTVIASDQPSGTMVWDFYTGAAIQSSPAIGRNGILYFGTDTGKLYSFYADGKGVWEYPTQGRIVSSPAIGADGTIYVGSYDGNLYALSPEGVELWRFQANGPLAASPAIGPGGIIVVGSLNKRLFALGPDGKKMWDITTSDPVVASATIGANGTVYVASADGIVAALDLRTGKPKWEFEAPNRVVSTPALGPDGSIYFGCFDGHLYALSPDGKKKWTYATGGPVRGSVAIGPDGMIYFGSDDRQLYALAPDGFKKWTFTTKKWIRSTPAVATDGTIYFGSYDHTLYAVDRDGSKKWEFVTDAHVTSSPTIGSDGMVFFGSWNGRFYAVQGGAPLAQGGWPRFRGNTTQTGYQGVTRQSPATTIAKAVSRSPSASAPVELPTTKPKPADPVVKVASTPKRERGRSKLGKWWDSVWGGGSKSGRNVAAAESEPMKVGEVREIANSDSLISQNVESPAVTVSVPKTEVPAPVAVQQESPVVSVKTVSPPPISSGVTSTMTMVGAAPARATQSPVTATETKLESHPAVTRIETHEIKPATTTVITEIKSPGTELQKAVAPTIPTINGKIPMMPLRSGGGASESLKTVPGANKTTLEYPVPAVEKTSAVEVKESAAETVTIRSTPPSLPEVDEVTVVERRLLPGLLSRAFNPKARAPKPPEPEPTPKIDHLNVRERNLLPGYFTRLIKGDGRDGKKVVTTESTASDDEQTTTGTVTKSTPKIDHLNVRERNLLPGYFTRLIKGDDREDKSVVTTESTASDDEQTTTTVTVSKSTSTAPEPQQTIIADSSDLIESQEEISAAWGEDRESTDGDAPGFFKRLFTRSRGEGETKKDAAASNVSGSIAPEKNPAVVSVKEVTAVAPAPKIEDIKPLDPPVQEVAAKAAAGESGRFDAKLAAMEKQMAAMRGELTETQKERDDLRRELEAGVGSRPDTVSAAAISEERTETANADLLQNDEPKLDTALAKAYGEKVSRMESQLISLNEELASARVERARLRNELDNARRSPSTAEIPVTEVRPPGIGGDKPPAARGLDLDIPQPAWLSNEVRSVIAAADPWDQPPGSAPVTVPTIPAAKTQVVSTPGVTAVPQVIPDEQAGRTALVLPQVPDPVVEKQVEAKKRSRKPGFFSRLFGRNRDEGVATTTPATNVVIVPSVPAGSLSSTPSDAQLSGADKRFGSQVVATNFPRIAYRDGEVPDFIKPGAGNLTQLQGFPRQQPVLIPPPTRAMDTRGTEQGSGLKNIEVRGQPNDLSKNRFRGTSLDDFKKSRPVVVVVSPADNARLSAPVLDLRGMVKSRRRVAQVLVSIAGGQFVPAAGLENWSIQAPVEPGLVLVRVKAVDADGVESEIEERTYHYQSGSALTVEIVGDGQVTPDLNGKELQVGKAYTVTAVAGPGSEFIGWSGAVSSSAPTLRFMMNNNLWLRASFQPTAGAAPVVASTNALQPVAAAPTAPFPGGKFTGLAYPRDSLSADRCGYLELEVGSDRSFLGQIRMGGSVAELRGEFDENWKSVQRIGRQSAAPIEINLRLERRGQGAAVIGRFDADGVPVVVHGYNVSGAGLSSAVRPGRYTLIIPSPPNVSDSPAGDGIGEVQIDSEGRIRFQGELPDGTRVSQESQVSEGGIWPLYASLYGGRGVLTGWITVTNHASVDLIGDLRWIRPNGAERGFAARRLVFGSEYRPDRQNSMTRMVSGVLSGGDLGQVVLGEDVASLPLDAPNRDTIKTFSFNVDPNSGLVEGTFIHPRTRKPTAFRGIHVQKQNWSSGYFRGPERSGMVHLQLK